MDPEALQADVLGEPGALRTLARSYAGGDGRSALAGIEPHPRRVLLIGMGSSYFAACDCAVAVQAAGLDAHAERASNGRPARADRETLAVVISASGGTREMVAAFERHRDVGPTVAVTAHPERALGAADHVLTLAGAAPRTETAVQSFQATVAVLGLLARRLAGQDLVVDAIERAAASLAGLVDSRSGWLGPLADGVGSAPVFIAAPHERMASAHQAALVVREAPRIVADACEAADWAHADVYLSLRPGYRLLLLGGSAWSTDTLDWMAARGREVVAVGTAPAGFTPAAHIAFAHAGDEQVAALVETTVFELLACELWRRARAERTLASEHPAAARPLLA